MNHETDPQEKDETARQKAYGETLEDNAADLNEQVTEAAGLRVGTPEDHGHLRDDGSPKPESSGDAPLDRADEAVLTESDERHPNLPHHAHSDAGPKRN